MKKLFPFFAILAGSELLAQPTINSATAPAAAVTHNSILIQDQANGNGSAYQSYTEYGQTPTALTSTTTPHTRPAGLSSHEEMLVGLNSWANVYWRKVYTDGVNAPVKTSIFQAVLSATTVTYLVVENLAVTAVTYANNTAIAKLRAAVKGNDISDTYFNYDYQSQQLNLSTNFVNKAAGIDTIEILVSGLNLNATVYFEAQSISGTQVVSAGSVMSFNTASPASVSELIKAQFKIYPNPVADKVTLDGINGFENCRFKLTDMLGRQVLDQEIKPEENADRYEIDLSAFAGGMYLFRYEAEKFGSKGTVEEKLLIAK